MAEKKPTSVMSQIFSGRHKGLQEKALDFKYLAQLLYIWNSHFFTQKLRRVKHRLKELTER